MPGHVPGRTLVTMELRETTSAPRRCLVRKGGKESKNIIFRGLDISPPSKPSGPATTPDIGSLYARRLGSQSPSGWPGQLEVGLVDDDQLS